MPTRRIRRVFTRLWEPSPSMRCNSDGSAKGPKPARPIGSLLLMALSLASTAKWSHNCWSWQLVVYCQDCSHLPLDRFLLIIVLNWFSHTTANTVSRFSPQSLESISTTTRARKQSRHSTLVNSSDILDEIGMWIPVNCASYECCSVPCPLPQQDFICQAGQHVPITPDSLLCPPTVSWC